MSRRETAVCCAIAALLVLCSSGCTRRRLASSERSQFIRSAKAELGRLDVLWEGREPTVSLDGDEVTVTFPSPKGTLGGDFIIKMERETKRVLDVRIWR